MLVLDEIPVKAWITEYKRQLVLLAGARLLEGLLVLLAALFHDGGYHEPPDPEDDHAHEYGQTRHQQPGGQQRQALQEATGLVARGLNDVAHLVHHVLHRGGFLREGDGK